LRRSPKFSANNRFFAEKKVEKSAIIRENDEQRNLGVKKDDLGKNIAWSMKLCAIIATLDYVLKHCCEYEQKKGSPERKRRSKKQDISKGSHE